MVNTSFWDNPPWAGGVVKHRLGLNPVEAAAWLSQAPRDGVLRHKREQLSVRYDEVVAQLPAADAAAALLQDLPLPAAPGNDYPDLIANVALTVADDLCLLDVDDHQRLIAGCVCAPSYWRLRDKLGKPLSEVHAPVDGMNAKIGLNIERFIARVPVAQPFARSNWFLHGDAGLYHPCSEAPLSMSVANWIVRSERQTLCRLSARYLLFTIDVVCEPLLDIAGFARARADLETSLGAMDADEVNHFGGVEKHRRLLEYVATVSANVNR